MRTFRGLPLAFHQHALDGAGQEDLSTDDILEAMERGTTTHRRSGRYECSLPRGGKVILVRYDYVEEEALAYWYVISVSRRQR